VVVNMIRPAVERGSYLPCKKKGLQVERVFSIILKGDSRLINGHMVLTAAR
jgi:hypothetical protein